MRILSGDFPKGRRNLKERDRECDVREFSEETGLTGEDYIIQEKTRHFVKHSLEQTIRYKHIYYSKNGIRKRSEGRS